MPKGDLLKPTRAKVRDRCYLEPGVVVNGFSRPQPIKGTILQSASFNGSISYLIVIDGERPPGRWYAAAGVVVKQGALQPVVDSRRAWVVVSSADGHYSARFRLDRNGVDSYLAEGYTVTQDEDATPS